MISLEKFKFQNKPLLIKIFWVRPRLALSLLLSVVIYLLIPEKLVSSKISKVILSWDVAASFYLILTAKMMFSASKKKISSRAITQDEGKFIILILVILAVFFALGAIVVELASLKEIHGVLRFKHITLAISTILISWLFTHAMFALHYAHDYYVALSRGNSYGGLNFPGNEKPDYADFLYFACVIGTSAQTADVSFTSKQMRLTGLIHCVLAFFFNTTLLALTINIASGLF